MTGLSTFLCTTLNVLLACVFLALCTTFNVFELFITVSPIIVLLFVSGTKMRAIKRLSVEISMSRILL